MSHWAALLASPVAESLPFGIVEKDVRTASASAI